MTKTGFRITCEDGESRTVYLTPIKPKIINGYWADVNGKKIDRLYIGETVYYFIETEGILDNTEIMISIYEKDDPPHIDNKLSDDKYYIKVKNNKGNIAFKIKESWLNLETKNKDSRYFEYYSQNKKEIRLYVEVVYNNTHQKFRDETIYLLYPLDDLSLKDGGGNVEHQRYTVQVKGSIEDYKKFKNIFTHSPQKITNNLLATYVPFDKNNDGKFSVGDQIDIDIKGPDNGSVRVARVDIGNNSFEVYFQALVGHTDAGNIRFSGKFIKNYFDYSNSLVEFEIYNITRVNAPLGIIVRILGGEYLSRKNQKVQWKNVLANFCNFFSKKPYIATQHTIEYEWDYEKENLGNLKKNKTKIITQEVNKCMKEPLNFTLW